VLTPAQVAAIAACVHSIREDWDTYAIRAALARVDPKKPAHECAIAAIKAAADPGNRFASVIAYEGAHWGRKPKSRAPEHWQPPHPCNACNRIHDPGKACGQRDPAVATDGAAKARAVMRGELDPDQLDDPDDEPRSNP
jgi:hypothetical protein